MKKKIILLTLLLGAGAALASCNGDAPSSKPSENLTQENTLSLQAVTSLNMVNSLSAPTSKTLYKKNHTVTEEETNKIKEVLPQLDLMLENGFDFKVTVNDFNDAINGTTYEKKETISFEDLNGESNVYTFYYSNSITLNIKDEDETKTKSIITGIATMDDETYFNFQSYLKTEQEEGEYEEKRTFIIWKDVLSFIKVEQKYEEEGTEKESKFAYTVIEDGRKTLDYSIKIEKEWDNLEIKYEINDVEYKMKKVIDMTTNETLYLVKYEDDENDVKARLTFKKVIGEDGTASFEIVK